MTHLSKVTPETASTRRHLYWELRVGFCLHLREGRREGREKGRKEKERKRKKKERKNAEQTLSIVNYL